MNKHLRCPLCAHENLTFKFSTKDYFLTGEEFDVHQCGFCGLQITNPFPDDLASIAYYQSQNYYSHPGKSMNPLALIYQLIRRWNVASKTRLLKKYCDSGNILDIGAGSGSFLESCQNAGFSVMGIEKDQNARNYCSTRMGLHVISPEHDSQIDESSQDAITLWHVLEHIHDLHYNIEKIKLWMKPGAYLVLALPNPESPDALFYGKYWAGWDVPRHLYHFSSDTMRFLGKRNNLRLVNIVPMRWDAFYVSILSEQYRGKSLTALRGLYHGLKSNFKAESCGNFSSLIYVFQKPEN